MNRKKFIRNILLTLPILALDSLAISTAYGTTQYMFRTYVPSLTLTQSKCAGEPPIYIRKFGNGLISVPKSCDIATIVIEGSGGGDAGKYIGGSGAKISVTLAGLKHGEYFLYGLKPEGGYGSATHGASGGGAAYLSLHKAGPVDTNFLIYAGGGGGAGAAGYGEPGSNGGNANYNTGLVNANIGSLSYFGGITGGKSGVGGASSGLGGGGGAGFFGGWGGYGDTFGKAAGSGYGGAGLVQNGISDCDGGTGDQCAQIGHQRGGEGGTSFLGGFYWKEKGTTYNDGGYSAAPRIAPNSVFPGLAVLAVSSGLANNSAADGYIEIFWN